MSVETTISTLRHAETVYSRDRRYAGSLDVPLSDAGIEDCRRAAATIAATRFDVVVTSGQKRAIDTSRFLDCRAQEFIQSDLCAERCFGIMEGYTWEEVQTLEPPVLFIEVGGDLHSVNPQGSEPFEDLWERARRFRRYLFREHRGKSVLVVSHSVFLQMFHGVLRGSNCIESLSLAVPSLALTSFHFSDNRLIGESTRQLVGESGPRF